MGRFATLSAMAIRISPFLQKDEAEVREFNNRVRGSDSAFEFPETAMPEWLPPAAGRAIFQERFLAIENGEVRGGYALKRQDFSFGGVAASIACYHSALSEGVAEERYSDVDAQLLTDALAREPLIYTLEADHAGRTPAGDPQTSEWARSLVPGYFHIVHPAAYLRNMETLRTTAWRRFLLSFAALTGLGWAGVRLHQRTKAKPRPAPPAAVDFFDVFGAWLDDLWTKCAPRYPFIAARDSATLGILYPGGKFLRMKIASGGATIGWAVAADTQMQWNREFGDMRLGSLIDCLALPEHAPQVITAVRRVLERRGVDLIVCNHSHPAWRAALRSAGFLDGGFNLVFRASGALTQRLEEIGAADNLFLTRGDGNARSLPEFGQAPL
jgi:hypothetical protein